MSLLGICAARRQLIRIVAVLLLAGAALNVVSELAFVLRSGHRVAYAPHMTIDSATYVREARSMIDRGEYFFTADTYHSAGMQVYVSTLLRLFGRDNVLAVKVVNYLLWLLVLAMVFSLAKELSGAPWAAPLALFLLSGSRLFGAYCAVVQYEVLIAFLFTLILFVHVKGFLGGRAAFAALGFVVGWIASFRVHFLALFVFLLLYHLGHRRVRPATRAPRLLAYMAGFLLFAVPWNALYSIRSGAPFFFQTAVDRQLHWYLNPNAAGYNFPRPPVVEPSGFRFIAEEPAAYAALVIEHHRYLWGFKPDIWFVESRAVGLASWLRIPPAAARRGFAAVYLAAWLAGAGFVVAGVRRGSLPPGFLVALLPVATILVIPLAIGSSTRFIVPIVSALLLLQLIFLLEVARRLRSLVFRH